MTWEAMPLGRLYRLRDQRAGSLANHLPLMSVSQYQGVVPRAGLMGDDGRAESLENYKLCEPGDLVLNRMSAYNGALGVARERGLVSPDYLVMEPTGAALADFLARWLKTPLGVAEMTKRLRGIGGPDAGQVRTPRLNHRELREIAIPLPPLHEQRAIGHFLDRETAKIDAMVVEQEGLVEVLRERRAAVISRAIGPDTGPLTSLGRLGHGAFGSGTDYSAGEGEPGWPRYVRTTDIAGMDSLHSDTVRRITVGQAGSSTIRRNDILFTRSGSLGTNYLHESDEVMAFAGYLVRFRPNTNKCVPRFIAWWSQSRHHLDQIAIGASKSTIDNFSGSKFRAMRVPTPSLSEQEQTADYLDEQTSKIDVLIAEAEGLVAVAKERRAALITAAVTGQIDVRGEVA